MNLAPCRKCGSTKIEIVCRTFSLEWKERFAICQDCGNMSQAIDWGLNEELDTEFTKIQWNYENGGGQINRIKRRLAIAKMELMVFEAIGGPIPRLTKWQKLKFCAECIFRWKKKSIVVAMGISKPGLVWTRWTYELTGEYIPPPWAITDDETEGEDNA